MCWWGTTLTDISSGHYCRRPTDHSEQAHSVCGDKGSNIWANLLLQMSYPVFMAKLQDEQNSHPNQKQSSGKNEEKTSLPVTSEHLKKLPAFPFS